MKDFFSGSSIPGQQVFDSTQERNGELRIRRYLKFEKFKHLLETRQLYCAPAHTFCDDLEGHLTHSDHHVLDTQLALAGFDDRGRATAAKARAFIESHNRRVTVMSCWTVAVDESSTMWTDYASADMGISIESTVGRLRGEFGPDFLAIPVQYVDFNSTLQPRDHSLRPFCYKRKQFFEWERELRFIGRMSSGAAIGSARLISIDLTRAIVGIIVSPNASEEFIETVQEMVSRSGLTVSVRRSCLPRL